MAFQLVDPSQAVILSVGSVVEGGTTHSSRPTITGTADAGTIVTIYDGIRILGSTTVDSGGNWSLTPVADLKTGVHQIAAIAMDSLHNIGESSVPLHFTVAAPLLELAPAVPQLQSLSDLAGLPVVAGGSTDNPHPVFSGAGVTGNIVTLYEGTTAIGSAIVTGGVWSITPVQSWTAGTHDLYAVQTNSAGMSSAASPSFEFTMNSNAPTISAFSEYDVNHVYVTELASGSTTAYQNFQLEGTATTPGNTIEVFDGSTLIGTTVARADGLWAYFLSTLQNGTHDLSVKQKTVSGVESASSSHISVTVAYTAPMAPNVLHVTQYASADGTGGANLVPWNTGSAVLSPYLNFYGRGEPGDQLKIYDGSVLIGVVTIGKTGAWGFVAPDFTIGQHDISMTQTNAAKVTSPSSSHFYMTVQAVPATGLITYNTYVAESRSDDGSGSDAANSIVATDQAATIIGGATHMAVAAVAPVAAKQSVATDTDTDTASAATATTVQHATVAEHDVFVGTAGVSQTVDLTIDPASYFKQATAHIEGPKSGTAFTLHLTGDHQVLDLTSLTGQTSAAKLSGIPVIDLAGHANNLKLSLVDVLNLGEIDLFQHDSKQQMMVNGSNGDTVDLSNTHLAGVADGDWQATGSTLVGGVEYNVYEHSAAHAEMLVKQGITVDIHG